MLAARQIQKKREEKANERQDNIKAAKKVAAGEMQERAKAAMVEFDADKDGVLNKAEIANLVKSMAADGKGLSDEGLESVILHCTGSRDGTVAEIECGAMIKTIEAYLKQSERVDRIFSLHDVDNSGALSYDELIPALRSQLAEVAPAARMTAGDVLYIIAVCDKDGDQCLSHDELLPAMGLWVELFQLLPELKDADDEITDEEMMATVKASLESGGAAGEDRLEQLKKEKQERLREALDARVHPLEGHKMLRKGMDKSSVRTMSGRKIVVENSELAQCSKAVAKRNKEKGGAAPAAKPAAAPQGRAAPASAPTTPRASEKKSSSCTLL